MDYKKIVWLASYPKSGNTWLRMFLDAYYLGEVDINDVVCSVTDDVATRCVTGNGEDPTTYPIDIQQLTRPMGLLRLVQQFNANSHADVPLFVKTHSAHMLTNGVELLPESLTKAVIHLVRDPRDVLPSFSSHMGLEGDAAFNKMDDKYNTLSTKGAPVMADFISAWDLHTNSFLNSDTHNIKTFRYEDMKEKPIETFSEILKHAGVTPDRDRVEKALKLVELDKLKKQEAKKGFGESSPHARDRFFGHKHKEITPKVLYRLEKKYGRIMKRLGYGNNHILRIADSR